MVNILTANHSGFPRIGTSKEEQKLRFALHKHDKNQINDNQLQNTINEVIKEVVAVQANHVDIVTDGQIQWYDPISHLLRSKNGITINGLVRFYDTNFYYRQPIIKGQVAMNGASVLKPVFDTLKSSTDKKTKAVATGPITIAEHSILEGSDTNGLEHISEVNNVICSELSCIEADYIQIDEPNIISTTLNENTITNLYDKLRSAAKCKLILSTYFTDAGKKEALLNSLPVDYIGIDTTYTLNFFERFKAENIAKPIQLGIVDARNTRMENIDELANKLSIFLNNYKHEDIILSPTASFEYLPRENATNKLKLLAELKNKL